MKKREAKKMGRWEKEGTSFLACPEKSNRFNTFHFLP
jgi:hypothetical protein